MLRQRNTRLVHPRHLGRKNESLMREQQRGYSQVMFWFFEGGGKDASYGKDLRGTDRKKEINQGGNPKALSNLRDVRIG
jgi:hypothetical protein